MRARADCSNAYLVAACLLLLVGCAKPGPVQEINLAGFKPEFQAGYRDGCSSATGGMNKDEKRFKSDRQYAQGWRDGFDICKKKKKKK